MISRKARAASRLDASKYTWACQLSMREGFKDSNSRSLVDGGSGNSRADAGFAPVACECTPGPAPTRSTLPAQNPIDTPTMASPCTSESPRIEMTQPPEQKSWPLELISVQ